jgi:RNA polymerase sigma-54 factor
MALKQNLQLKLQQKLSPQQIQLMKLLQVPTAAIEQRIKEELEDNPALEERSDDLNTVEEEEYSDVYDEVGEAEQEFDFSDYVDDDDIPDYRLYSQNKGADEEDRSVPVAMGVSFVETLTDQFHLQHLTEKERQIGDMIIGNLDESGYLRRDIDALADDLAFTANIMAEPEEIEEVLKKIQELDPPGVGARDLRECLLLQLQRKEDLDEVIETSTKIISNSFDEFSKKHYNKILTKFDISEELLRESIDEIKSLNPKPGNTGLLPVRRLPPLFLIIFSLLPILNSL